MKIEIKGLTEEQTGGLQKAFDALTDDLQKEVSKKLEKFAGVEALKEISDLLKIKDEKSDLLSEMQKQLNEMDITLQKQKHNPRNEVKTFAQELKESLTKEAEKLTGMKAGAAEAVKHLQIEVKSFLETANASVTTGSLLPQYQYDPGLSKAPDRMPFMMDIVTSAVANSLTVFWTQRKTRTDNSEWVAEGVSPAAQTVLGYETKTATMQNLSAFIKASNNSLDDISWLLSEIQTELMTLLMLKVDAALLTGTVATVGFDGVLTKATAFSAGGDTLGSGLTPNKFDALVYAITQVQIAHFNPNYIILNPADVRDLKLTRDDNGAYMLPPTMAVGNNVAVDGIRIISNTGITKGTYLVGDFSKAKFWIRKGLEIRVWEQNDTDAEDQLKTITAYMRGTLVIKDADTAAFVTDTFADTITEITTV